MWNNTVVCNFKGGWLLPYYTYQVFIYKFMHIKYYNLRFKYLIRQSQGSWLPQIMPRHIQDNFKAKTDFGNRRLDPAVRSISALLMWHPARGSLKLWVSVWCVQWVTRSTYWHFLMIVYILTCLQCESVHLLVLQGYNTRLSIIKEQRYKCQQKFCTNIQLWFDVSLQLGYGSFLLALTGRTGTGLKHQG